MGLIGLVSHLAWQLFCISVCICEFLVTRFWALKSSVGEHTSCFSIFPPYRLPSQPTALKQTPIPLTSPQLMMVDLKKLLIKSCFLICDLNSVYKVV